MELSRGAARDHAPVRVQATKLGYYAEARRREGDVFVLDRPEHFTRRWMRMVPADTPLRSTTAQQAIDSAHDKQTPLRRVIRTTEDIAAETHGRAIGLDEPYL